MRRRPDKVAVIHGDRQLTFRTFVGRIEALADAAAGTLGLRPGMNAAIAARNSIAYLEIACGVPEAGVALATINARLTPAEIVAICDDAQAEVLFADPDLATVLRGLRFKAPTRIIEIGAEYESLLAGALPQPRPLVEEWATWTIPYTSGTTGQPKGVLVSHRSRILISFAQAAEFGCFGPDDRFLSVTPMNFGGGLAFPLGVLLFGGTAEIMDKFDPAAVLQKLKFGGTTGTFLVPTQFYAMLNQPAEVLEACRRPPVRTIISNAAPLSQAMKERLVPYFGAGILHETYASTEGGIITNLRPVDQLRKQSCVGLPFAQTLVEIRDESGKPCAPGDVGELFSRSPYLFNGYWNRPGETAAAFRDGWVSVGDMAKRDAEGFIYIVDRKKDMVITGGINVFPREIEEVLLTHAAIADVAVIGVPDERWGERLKAIAVLRPGQSLTLEELTLFCAGKVAGYKVPKDLAVVEVLPRNANNKVLKTELRKLK